MANRSFIDFDGSTSFGTLSAPVTFAGDFEIEFDYATTATVTGRLLSTVDSNSDGIEIYHDGATDAVVARLTIATVNTWIDTTSTIAVTNDGKLHNIKLTRVGDLFSIYIDGVFGESVTRAVTTVDWNVVGIASNLSTHFNGTIANVRFSDLVTPANDLFFPLSEPTLDYEISGVAGAELIVDGTFPDATNWTSINDATGAWTIANNKASVNCTSNSALKNNDLHVTSAQLYLVTYTVEDYVSGLVRIRMGTGGNGTSRNANGTYTELILGVVNANNISFEADFTQGFNGSVSNVSAVSVDNAVDFTSISRWNATQVVNDWVGDELITNGTFDADTDWIKGTDWTIANNVLSCNNSAQSHARGNTISSILDGGVYRTNFTVSNYVSGSVRAVVYGTGSFQITPAVSDNGTYTNIIGITNAGGSYTDATNIQSYPTTFVGDVDNVSVTRFLEDVNLHKVKPSYDLQLDTGNFYASNLGFAFLPPLLDNFSGAFDLTTVDSPATATGKYGSHAVFSSSTTEYYSAGDNFDTGTSNFTLTAIFKTGADTAYNPTLISKSIWSGDNDRFSLWIDDSLNTGLLSGQLDSGVGYIPSNNTGGDVLDDVIHIASVSVDRNGLLSTYVDGVLTSSIDVSAESAVNIDSTHVLLLGLYNDTVGSNDPPTEGRSPYEGEYYAAYGHTVAFSQAEVEALHADYYQMFKENFGRGTKTIGTGGDFETIADWSTAVKALGTLTENSVGQMTDDKAYAFGATADLDFSGVTLSGYIITLQGTGDGAHDGDFGNGSRVVQSVTGALYTPVISVDIEDFSIENTGTAFNDDAMSGIQGCNFSRVLGKTNGAGSYSFECFDTVVGASTFEACRADGGGYGFSMAHNDDTLLNCSSLNQTTAGFVRSGFNPALHKNNVAYNCGTGWDASVGGASSVNNASEDGTHPENISTAVVVRDTFDGTNGTLINAHTPNIDTVGGGWYNTDACTLDGTGGLIFPTIYDDIRMDTGLSDQRVIYKMTPDTARFRVLLRKHVVNDTGYNFSFRGTHAVTCELERVDGGTFVPLAVSGDFALSGTESHLVVCEMIGTTANMYINGVLAITFEDSTHTIGTEIQVMNAHAPSVNAVLHEIVVEDPSLALTTITAADFAADGYTPLSTGLLVGAGTASASPVTDAAGNPYESAELVTNGGFDADTNWSKGTGWTIAGGVLTATAVGSNANSTTSTGALVDDGAYFVEYTVSNYSSGQVNIELISASGFSAESIIRTANGTYTEILTLSDLGSPFTNVIMVRNTSGAAGTYDIDNISVKRLPSIGAYELPQGAGVRTIGTAGYFTEIADWSAAVKSLGTLQEASVGTLIDDKNYAYGAASDLVFSSVTLNGFTITFKADPSVKHNGNFGNGARVEGGPVNSRLYAANSLIIEDLSFRHTADGSYNEYALSITNCTVRRVVSESVCLLQNSTPFEILSPGNTLESCLAKGGQRSFSANTSVFDLINCTSINAGLTGIHASVNNHIGLIQNVVVYNAVGDAFDTSMTWNGTYSNNASEDGTHP